MSRLQNLFHNFIKSVLCLINQAMKNLFLLIAMGSQVIFGQTFNPNTFNISNLEAIANGALVNLEPGTYEVNQDILTAWSSGLKSNIQYRGPENGTVIIDASSLSNPGMLEFVNWNELSISHITFHNVELVLNGCNNAVIDAIEVKNNQYDSFFANRAMLRILYGNTCTLKNSLINWTFTGWTGKGVKVLGGSSHLLENNQIIGGLRGGVAMRTLRNDTAEGLSVNPVTNHRVTGGHIKRDISEGDEDHGLYLHNISHVTIENVTFEGWSDTPAGQGIKLKGANYIEVRNNTFYDSGLIIRIANNWHDSNDHLWVHNNEFHQGNINSWTNLDDNFTINNSAVVEQNVLHVGTIVANKEDPNIFNAFNSLANKLGGVFNNCTFEPVELVNGITASANTLIANSCSLSSDQNFEEEVILYPNPVNQIIHINFKGRKRIYNILGEHILTTNSKNIDVSSFKSGTYIVKINNKKSFINKQFVKIP